MTAPSPQKCLTVALVGLPNAGKSTLVNALIGEKIAAVHRKPQMTRKNLLGFITEGSCQLIFIDTPGIHSSEQALNQSMVSEWQSAIQEADFLLLLLDVTQKLPEDLIKRFTETGKVSDYAFVLNKIDFPDKQWKIDPEKLIKSYQRPTYVVSALKGHGVDKLVTDLRGKAKPHPFFYDPDILTTATYRELASELLREKVMEFLHDEIPYESAVLIESFQELPKRVVISAVIVVNRESHKGMVIGQQGQNLERIRKAAHAELKKLLDQHVRLKLFVKVDKNWVKNSKKIDTYR